MRRFHLFEFNDQPWCPQILREFIMELLNTASLTTGVYNTSFEKIIELLPELSNKSIHVPCAGGGGPILALLPKLLDKGIEVTFSDLYPCAKDIQIINSIYGVEVKYDSKSIDVKNIPVKYNGLRIIFNSIHHLKPSGVKDVLSDAVNKKCPIAIMEPVQRDWISLFKFALLSPLLCAYWCLGGIRPFSLKRFFLGVLFPVGTLCFIFDGIVSHLRAYKIEELEQIVHAPEFQSYTWKLELLDGFMGSQVTSLIGIPRT